jgi:hypothetical protein
MLSVSTQREVVQPLQVHTLRGEGGNVEPCWLCGTLMLFVVTVIVM